MDERDYRARIKRRQRRLFGHQRACRKARLGVILVFEGWSAAGKGKVIRAVTRRLEPRGIELHAIRAPRTSETHLPWLYRFWKRIPAYGTFALFDRSWYRRVLREPFEGSVSAAEAGRALDDIVAFERSLAADRYVVAKFFLDLERDEQRRRLDERAADPAEAWRVTDVDREQNLRYDEYRALLEPVLTASEAPWAPWTRVDADDERRARLHVLETLDAGLGQELARREEDR